MHRNGNNNQTLKSKSTTKRREKPEWVSTFVDRESYKLTPSELIQKKISLISKHQMEAKDEWKTLQENLKKGVVNDDTSKIFKTALSAKGLGIDKYGVTRRNLTQMMHLELTQKSEIKEITQNDEPNQNDINFEDIDIDSEDILERAKYILNSNPKQKDDFLCTIQKDLHETRQLIRIVDKNSNSKNPEKLLNQLKQLSNKKENKENTNPSVQNLKIVKKSLDTKTHSITQKSGSQIQQRNILDDLQLTQKDCLEFSKLKSEKSELALNNSKLTGNELCKPKKLDYQKEIEEFERQTHHKSRNFYKSEDLLQPISPSRFFQDSIELNEPSTIQQNNFLDTEAKYEEADFLDLESIRRMLEDTKIALDKMNLRGEELEPLNLQEQKQELQQYGDIVPCQLDYEDEIQPRSFTVTQHRLDVKQQNLKQHTFMMMNNNYI